MKYFSSLISHLSSKKGFTLIELLLTISFFAIFIGIITLNLNTAQHKATIQETVETLLTDLNQQQVKAMAGDTEGRATLDTYGIHFNSDRYTLFHGTYNALESGNFDINLDDIFQISTTFTTSDVIFEKGSGEIVGYNPDADTITVTDITNGEQKIIELNKLGVVTSIN